MSLSVPSEEGPPCQILKYYYMTSRDNRVGGQKMTFGSKFANFEAFRQAPVNQTVIFRSAYQAKVMVNLTYHLVEPNLSLCIASPRSWPYKPEDFL